MLRKQRAQVAMSKQSQSQTANSVTQGATSSIAFGQTSTSSAGFGYTENSNPISAQLKNLGNLNNDVVEQMNGFNITGKETELQRQDTEENSIIEAVENTHLADSKQLLLVHLLKRFCYPLSHKFPDGFDVLARQMLREF